MKKQNQSTITLQQLQIFSIVTPEGDPATLYQIAYYTLGDRPELAIEAAKNGDFLVIDGLITEVNKLIDSFVQHGLFLTEERAIIKDPDGPEARQRIEIRNCARRQYRANMAESRKQKRLSREGGVNNIPV